MDFKEKILTQAIVCCMIFVTVEAVSYLPGEPVDRLRAAVKAELSRNYTVEEVKEAASDMLERAKETPQTLVNAVLAMDEGENPDEENPEPDIMEDLEANFVEENSRNAET